MFLLLSSSPSCLHQVRYSRSLKCELSRHLASAASPGVAALPAGPAPEVTGEGIGVDRCSSPSDNGSLTTELHGKGCQGGASRSLHNGDSVMDSWTQTASWLGHRLADSPSRVAGCVGERNLGSGRCQEPECASYSDLAALHSALGRRTRPSPVGLTQEPG